MELVGRLALGVMCTRSLEGSLSTQVLSLVYGTSAGWSHVEEGIEIAEPENYVVWSAPPEATRKYHYKWLVSHSVSYPAVIVLLGYNNQRRQPCLVQQ